MEKVRFCRKCENKLPTSRYYHCLKCVKTLTEDEDELVYHTFNIDERTPKDE